MTIDTTLSENTTAQGSTDRSAASLTTPHTTIVQNILRSADILVLHPENIPIQQVNMLLNSALMWHMQEEDILNHSKEKLLEFLLKEFGEHTVLDNTQKQQIQKIMGMLPIPAQTSPHQRSSFQSNSSSSTSSTSSSSQQS